ncbi:hypothetical protein DCC81_04140 [Chitinophaga parva]|uniref:RNA polymerase sigma factor n=1 Tax=Chitinophaga parva TaxID=2169414 RepID=A0A2T7BLY8_9BACT|nr:sigma-70 family RNA polymerase sigma factor [Chitinophaga parva]PUZ28682.1 hypothetical protein DCC81_04140 [Chitinophaga parva]
MHACAKMHDALLQRARDGDRDALNALLSKHRDLAFSIALKYLKQPADAEDVVQDAFIRVFLQMHRFRNEAAFSTWLYKIIYYEALRKIQQLRRIPTISEEALAEEAEETAASPEELRLQVDNAMRCLTANEYMIVNLFYLMEKDIREIVQITGHSAANIKVLLHRGRKRMAASLQAQKESYE